jgi:hypothetical protein
MSQTFSLVCHETKKCVWVGQGHGSMTVFYSGESQTMEDLGQFLREHEGKPLFLLCDDENDMFCEYKRLENGVYLKPERLDLEDDT